MVQASYSSGKYDSWYAKGQGDTIQYTTDECDNRDQNHEAVRSRVAGLRRSSHVRIGCSNLCSILHQFSYYIL